jgi:hypothetical protein
MEPVRDGERGIGVDTVTDADAAVDTEIVDADTVADADTVVEAHFVVCVGDNVGVRTVNDAVREVHGWIISLP